MNAKETQKQKTSGTFEKIPARLPFGLTPIILTPGLSSR